MTISQKIKIAQAITKILKWDFNLPIETIESKIKINPYYNGKFTYIVPQVYHLNNPTSQEISSLEEQLQTNIVYKSVLKKMYLQICVDKNEFIKDTLTLDLETLFQYRKKSKIIVEFSSPNIAKPFHLGHLRSTIVGNYIANINKYFGNEVIKINYLGDWGIQFGLMKIGLEDASFNKNCSENRLKLVQEAYAFVMKNADKNPDVFEQAKKIFCEFDHVDDNNIKLKEWRTYQTDIVKELSCIYKRLGVTFDEYAWESDYSANRIQPMIDEMKQKGILKQQSDQSYVTILFDEIIPFTKNDGTTLYLSRDVASALDRYRRHKFDKMYYVVDGIQAGHFAILESVLRQMGTDCVNKIEHVRFGRVHSERAQFGETLSLDDILNVLRHKVNLLQLQTFDTKLPVSAAALDVLSTSTLIVNDLRIKKKKHYDFSWDVVLKVEGFSGFALQYTHCKLVSLEEECCVTLPNKCEPKAFKENVALVLINHIARFPDILNDSYKQLEACYLVNYLLDLCSLINAGLEQLQVHNDDSYVASQRLLLFVKARIILNLGMRIVGLTPLNKMR